MEAGLLDTQDQEESNIWDKLRIDVQTELEQTQREVKEISLMLEQSQVEVNKLAQRNATITMHLQQVQTQLETIPPDDVRVAYDAALDAQQRLVVMRSQVEKLQSDKEHLDRMVNILTKLRNALEGGIEDAEANSKGTFATAEMMIQAQEAERQRLSRQMHDGPAQQLSNFILQTEIAMRLFDIDQDKARAELSNLKGAASTAFQQVRDFIFDLRPMMLDDLGLIPTIKRYVDAFRDKTGMDVTTTITGKERRLESYLEVLVFRSVQELLRNAHLHSQATQVRVQIDMLDTEIRASVEDNGKGFNPDAIEENSGLGIKLIRERVDMLKGVFQIDSAVGQGVRVALTIPSDVLT
jgi:two-component system sensor histidine kinase DegS